MTLIQIVNDNKHNRLTPHVERQYKVFEVTVTIPPGETVVVDMTQLPVGTDSSTPVRATVGTWKGLVFEGTDVKVITLLKYSLPHVRGIVEELSVM